LKSTRQIFTKHVALMQFQTEMSEPDFILGSTSQSLR